MLLLLLLILHCKNAKQRKTVLLFFSLSLPRFPSIFPSSLYPVSLVLFIHNPLSFFPLTLFLISPFRQYYEMLYNTADELLNLVVDQGVRYTELEYINALSLLHRSQTGVGDLSTQNIRLQRLKEIICEQAAIKQASKDKKITTV